MTNPKIDYLSRTMQRKVIYVYKKLYLEESGYLKIGDASIDNPSADLRDNSDYLLNIAEKRIRQYDNSSDIEIIYATIATDKNWNYFRDHKVHRVLERSGYSKVKKGNSTEWFRISKEIAISAIEAVKKGDASIFGVSIDGEVTSHIEFRPEQNNAIEQTLKVFKSKKDMLWNAKMRFGKTLCALEVVKKSKMKRTIIITHRPIVDAGWYTDFNKIFNSVDDNFEYGSKNKGSILAHKLTVYDENNYVYFASLQDLRESEVVIGDAGYPKHFEVFSTKWDFIIIDEAHEGANTEQAEAVISLLRNDNTKMLKLSGTPFNLLDDYEESQIFTWDYVMEQEAKSSWDATFPGDSNPYESLPKLEMYVYELGDVLYNDQFVDIETKSFNFAEFFRTDFDDRFIYESEVWSFLNYISKSEDYSDYKSNMPFSTSENREALRHTLWTLPSRKSAVALEQLIKSKKHPIFSHYNIANLVDDGDSEPDLEKIQNAITNTPETKYSITLTVRKGTVGTTVKEWSGIFVLNNTESASNYLQSIFRVQTPYIGKKGQKEKAYIFDFAPDRSLKMVAEAAKLNTRGGSLNNDEQQQKMLNLLNFLPIIGIDGNKMIKYNITTMLSQLKRAQAERAVANGFDDASIYNDQLLKLTDVDLDEFDKLRSIVGKTMQTKRINTIDINNQGLTSEEWDKSEKAKEKSKRNRTIEEEELLDKRAKLQNQRKAMISVLRGISIRIPLMIYGMENEIDDDITLDNFTSSVDDVSWEEFMPSGVDKDRFNSFKKYYDPEIFIEAGRKIRRVSLAADKLPHESRIDKIISIFNGFKNPDKETVLTPWRVVNMHMGQTIGGYNFFDNEYSKRLDAPVMVNSERTNKYFKEGYKYLEINSKTGLYPLYITYTLYKQRWNSEHSDWLPSEWIKKDRELWEETIEQNIFVLNKTPMARRITYRTLMGYQNNSKIMNNIVYVEDLVSKLKISKSKTADNIIKKIGGKDMKFDVIVGNPPYQENDNAISSHGTVNASASPLYHLFFDIAKMMSSRYISLIFPARWLSGAGKGLTEFSRSMLEDTHIKKLHIYKDSSSIFPNTDIKGGVLYLTYDKLYNGPALVNLLNDAGEVFEQTTFLNSADSGVFIPFKELVSIYEKVTKDKDFISFQSIVSTRKPFGLGTDFFTSQAKYGLPDVDNVKLHTSDLEIIGLNKSQRTRRYVRADYPITQNTSLISKWKVLTPYAYGNGSYGEAGPSSIIGKPGHICTETFLAIGGFDTEYETKAVVKYMKTKFFRSLVGILKSTQHSTTTFQHVPLLIFDNNSTLIDWSQTISQIDKELYEIYKLSVEEIEFIEKNVHYML